jgi:hypothetical protein
MPKSLRYVIPAVAVLCLIAWCLLAIRPHFAWDDAEPEILNQAWRLANSQPIYKPIENPPYIHTAYPPVYLALTAATLKLTGLNTIGAKLLSMLAALAIALGLAHLSSHWHSRASTGFFLFCFLLITPAFLYNVTRVHVQMLAVAFSLWSFILLYRSNIATFLGAVLATCAIFTKQTQFAILAAAVICFAICQRRRLLVFLPVVIVLGGISLVVLELKTGGQFLRHTVVLNALSYDIADIPLVLLHHAGPLVVFIAFAAVTVWRRLRARAGDLLDLYFAVAAVLTVISSGRLGAHTQYVVELLLVTLLVVLREWPLRNSLILAQAVILVIYAPLYVFIEEGRPARASNSAAESIYSLLESVPGPVLSQQSSFSLFSHGEIPVQLFHFSALSREGLWDQSKLLQEVESENFTWVVTEFPLEGGEMSASDRERFTPELVEVLRRHYRRSTAIGPYFIYNSIRVEKKRGGSP